MSKNKKTGVFILLFLFSAIYSLATFPDTFANISKKISVKGTQETTDKSNVQSEPSSSPQNSSLPEQTVEIMIDPGHGGIDSGAEKGHIVESEVTLDISEKLKVYLEANSYRVAMTRSSDISLYQLSKISDTIHRRELDARTNIINESGAKIFVSIHVNSYPEYPGISGSIVYYNPAIPQSKELSNCIQNQLNDMDTANSKREKHNAREADFFLLINSNIPGVLVETAFITNTNDRKLLSQDSFRSQIAKAVADGICNYMDK
jgi:N-acetylmuramoyl-L-alanine amidase